ncbi:hypothetical protein IJG89_03280 [Candidatus Saccharibacteria bacterium]|nr:hypothetical protein [Candidatus Saccharibacteria bacterium]
MKKISQIELNKIVASYGFGNLSFKEYMQVEPDTALYILCDDKGAYYILLVSDYLGGYDEIKLPHRFMFDYYPEKKIRFDAICSFSYVDNAPKAAADYIDDNHLKTQASTGDICMLFSVDKLKKI